MGTERRHHLDELTIARIVRDSMSQVDRSRKLPAAARKSLSLQIASRLAEAECRATLDGISHLAGVSPPKSQDVGDAARELVQAIHARLGASLRKEADHLSLGDVPHKLAAEILRGQAMALADGPKDEPAEKGGI